MSVCERSTGVVLGVGVGCKSEATFASLAAINDPLSSATIPMYAGYSRYEGFGTLEHGLIALAAERSHLHTPLSLRLSIGVWLRLTRIGSGVSRR
jgi:hypothetical protein